MKFRKGEFNDEDDDLASNSSNVDISTAVELFDVSQVKFP